MQIGDYFILGKYNEEPIVWRYVADDENGKLIVSDKILCLKTIWRKIIFGKNLFKSLVKFRCCGRRKRMELGSQLQ